MEQMAGDSWDNKWNLVFTKDDGSNLAVNTVYHNYKRLVNEIGCADLRFHDLRHSFASTSLENGDDAKTVQENLGEWVCQGIFSFWDYFALLCNKWI